MYLYFLIYMYLSGRAVATPYNNNKNTIYLYSFQRAKEKFKM